MKNNTRSGSNVHYKLPFKFGLGGVPLGNEFAVVTDKDAYAILEAAWSAGIRYYDVAPWYGLGLAERRYGSFLHNKKRSEYVIPSKVGKLLKASRTAKNRELFPFSPSPNDVIFDYTSSGVRRSIEDSLQRLGIDSLDVVFVHDISSDNRLLPTIWQKQFDIAAKGAFPELTRMREEGLIKGWGIGVNIARTDSASIKRSRSGRLSNGIAVFLDRSQECAQPAFSYGPQKERLSGDWFLAERRIHLGESSLQLWKRPHTKYPPNYWKNVKKLREVAANHGVDLRTAALQFSASPDVAAALVVGASSEQQILADYTSMQTKIPAEFWAELNCAVDRAKRTNPCLRSWK